MGSIYSYKLFIDVSLFVRSGCSILTVDGNKLLLVYSDFIWFARKNEERKGYKIIIMQKQQMIWRRATAWSWFFSFSCRFWSEIFSAALQLCGFHGRWKGDRRCGSGSGWKYQFGTFLILGFAMGLTGGLGICISHSFGANDIENCGKKLRCRFISALPLEL